MAQHIGDFIARKRKELGYTQQKLANELNISFQAVSKWENGTTFPDIHMLAQLASSLHTTVDAIVGYSPSPQTQYEDKYSTAQYYWGISPNKLCYEIMKLRPPVQPLRVLDIGCGEGRDAVFLARNGYAVTGFDLATAGIEKARELAQVNRVDAEFFRADVNDYQPQTDYDIVFSSGVLHYIAREKRKALFDSLKEHTAPSGIHVLNVFVSKPFISMPPDSEDAECRADPWYSGELAYYYHDWRIHQIDEIIFDCSSGGIAHQHCMNVLIAEKPIL